MQTPTAAALPRAPASESLKLGDFIIPTASSHQESRPRILKHGDTFGVFDPSGDVLSGPASPEGIYHCDTRYLSHLHIALEGVRPVLLGSTLRDDNASLTCDLANPDLRNGRDEVTAARELIHVRRTKFLWNAAAYERITVTNYDEKPRQIRIEIAFAADFADLFEVRGAKRERRGVHHPAAIGPDEVRLAYTGLDGQRRETRLRFEPAPAEAGPDRVAFTFDLASHQTWLLYVEADFSGAGAPQPARAGFLSALRASRRSLHRASARTATIRTSNDIFNETVARAIADLNMLMTDKAEGPYPYAGIPWFSTVFGRDALITAWQMLWFDPSVARGVLGHLAANQATSIDPAADAEPGKILHEVRLGEMAELREVPFRRYYGSIDSTPLFIMLAGAYFARTADLETVHRLWPALEAALNWIEEYGDRDGDGFVEYGRRTSDGLINQAWKDSHDSVFHADGTLAQGPIAICEVQAYVYGAWCAAADISRALGEAARARAFHDKAARLQQRFDERFFDAALGTYVLALDGEKKPCRVRSSNAGHALFAGIALPERVGTVVGTLMNAASFSGWGVRTVPTTEARYNPMSYHNGSVWPHDNAMIAAGFSRYGYRQEATRIFGGLFAAAGYIEYRRLPELFCGFLRRPGRGPTLYPVACEPQAWAAGTFLSLLQSSLGLGFRPQERQILFEHPALPGFLDMVAFGRLAVGNGAASVTLRRTGSEIGIAAHTQQGDVRVVSHA